MFPPAGDRPGRIPDGRGDQRWLEPDREPILPMMTPSHMLVNLTLLGGWIRTGQARCRAVRDAILGRHRADQRPVPPLSDTPRADRSPTPAVWLAILIGAALPDVPRLLETITSRLGTPGSSLSGSAAVSDRVPWAILVDAFHSIPLVLCLVLLALLIGRRALLFGTVSALLHDIEDLLTHTSEPHHHLWPLSSWTFTCPLPQWTFGEIGYHLGIVETALVLAMSVPLYRLLPRGRPRHLLLAADLVYAGLGIQAAVALLRH